MAVTIRLDQAGNPTPGDSGFAREDFITGAAVTAHADGGPFLQTQWSWIDRPIDLDAPAQSAATIQTPAAAATLIQPIDLEGTYFLKVVVDSGFGLGARPEDQARITFYAGAVLNTQWDELPRRMPAFLERLEHNVKGDPIFGAGGNLRGWAQEWLRWFGLIKKIRRLAPSAWAYVQLTGVGATVPFGSNVASAVRNAQGRVTITFTTALASASYIVIPVATGAIGGSACAVSQAGANCVIERADPMGVLVDGDFALVVLGP